MRNKVAKRLRKEAQELTVGKTKSVTRKRYKLLKKQFKSGKHKDFIVKFDKALELKVSTLNK
jgi:hypothetical protein